MLIYYSGERDMNIHALKSILPLISVVKAKTLSNNNLPPICDGTEDVSFFGQFFLKSI